MERKIDQVDFEVREKHNSEHGSPFDRGAADSWYSRSVRPHKRIHLVDGSTVVIKEEHLTAEEVQAYLDGYAWNEQYGDKKNWD